MLQKLKWTDRTASSATIMLSGSTRSFITLTLNLNLSLAPTLTPNARSGEGFLTYMGHTEDIGYV